MRLLVHRLAVIAAVLQEQFKSGGEEADAGGEAEAD